MPLAADPAAPTTNTPLRRKLTMGARILRNARARPRLPAGGDQPLVSVIMATYNWSSVLRYAIGSVLSQTYPRFELLVIGDACTDDSARVVASFADPRVRWINRASNSGSQVGPNNDGLAAARGEYVAYHGHDDVWLPTHLALLVEAMRRDRADVGNTLTEMIGPPRSNIRGLAGHGPTGGYVPPSSLMHRREAGLEVGGWRDFRTISLTPDHEFPARLHAHGLRFTVVEALTVFKFPSSLRRNSYRERPSHEQAEYTRRIATERGFVYRELAAMAKVHLLRRRPRYPEAVRPPDPIPPGWHVTQARRVRGLD
jgi:glycosyltransferase involved in cell wall biosynthesis